MFSASTNGIQINDDQNGGTPLYAASQNGNVAIVKILIKASGNVNQATTTDGASPLFIASDRGHVAIVKVLIKSGGTHTCTHVKSTLLNLVS